MVFPQSESFVIRKKNEETKEWNRETKKNWEQRDEGNLMKNNRQLIMFVGGENNF